MKTASVTYRIADVRGGDDPRVEENTEKLDYGVEVEEHEDFLAAWLGIRTKGFEVNTEKRTNCSVFATDMKYHDTRHEDCHNVYETCRYRANASA